MSSIFCYLVHSPVGFSTCSIDMAEEVENKIDMCSNPCDYIRSFPSHGFHLLEQLNVQRYYGTFCDITVRVDDVDYSAHRCILAASSAKLQSLIYSIRQEWNNVLVIKDVTPTAFQVVLDFIYTGSVRLMSSSVHDVLETARYLEIPDVEKVCLCYIDCMHSEEERNVGNSANMRLMPELAPIAEVNLDGQMSTTSSKMAETGSFDAIAQGFDKTCTARTAALHSLYNSKPCLPFLSPSNNPSITIETIEDYLKLVENRQSSLVINSSNHQNWSPVFDTRNADAESGVHRVLPNLVRIDEPCSSRFHNEDRTSLISDDSQRIKFSSYPLDKLSTDANQVRIGKDSAVTRPINDEMFDYGTTDDDSDEECASFLKISPLPGNVMTNENCDGRKTILHVVEPVSSCITYSTQRGADSFTQIRCEDMNLETQPTAITEMKNPLLRLTSIDPMKRNRKKAPKKFRAAEVSSSDDSTFISDIQTTPTFTSEALGVSTFPLAMHDTSVFVSNIPEVAGFAIATDVPHISSHTTNATDAVGAGKAMTSTHVFDDSKQQSSQKLKYTSNIGKNKLGVTRPRSVGAETKESNTPMRPFKKRIKLGQKRDGKDATLFSCTLCNKKFGRASELTRHQRGHTSQLYRCRYCPSEFTNPVLYKRHFICMHGERNAFFCVYPSCKFRSDRLSNVEKHAIIHTDIKLFSCTHCGKSFSQDNGLRSHLLSCTQAQSYLCDICGAKFNHLQSMRSHRRVHTGEKPYQCTDCGSQFADHRNFKRHRRIHENIFPYPCLFCDKRFRHSNSLKAHMTIHDLCQNSN